MCPDHPERESEGAECGQGPCLSSCQGKCGATDGFLAASSSCLGGKARLHLLPPRRSSSHVPFPSSLGLFQNPSTARSSTSAVSQEAKPQRGWRLASVHRTQRDLRNEPQMGICVCVCVCYLCHLKGKIFWTQGKFSDSSKVLLETSVCLTPPPNPPPPRPALPVKCWVL